MCVTQIWKAASKMVGPLLLPVVVSRMINCFKATPLPYSRSNAWPVARRLDHRVPYEGDGVQDNERDQQEESDGHDAVAYGGEERTGQCCVQTQGEEQPKDRRPPVLDPRLLGMARVRHGLILCPELIQFFYSSWAPSFLL